jgi:polar amino acid transport system ATP-binding protein
MTMLIATHEMGFARRVADRVCFLDRGVIVEQGPPAQVLDDPQQSRTRQFLRQVTGTG